LFLLPAVVLGLGEVAARALELARRLSDPDAAVGVALDEQIVDPLGRPIVLDALVGSPRNANRARTARISACTARISARHARVSARRAPGHPHRARHSGRPAFTRWRCRCRLAVLEDLGVGVLSRFAERRSLLPGDGAPIRVGLGLDDREINDQARRRTEIQATDPIRGTLVRAAHARLSARKVVRQRRRSGERIAAQRQQQKPRCPTHAPKVAPFLDLDQRAAARLPSNRFAPGIDCAQASGDTAESFDHYGKPAVEHLAARAHGDRDLG
jgi:hypothetical protein